MDKRLQNKLKTYSALSAVATLVASSAEAQIVHTTVNYTGGYETYDIDLDNDGTVDFAVNAFATAFPYGAYTIDIALAQIYANGSNRMIGVYGSNLSYIYAMNAGMVVNSTYYNFISSGALAGKFKLIGTFYSFPVTLYEGSFGQFGDGSTKFVGVEFEIPLTGDTHYGWLRFKDVEQDGSSWTLVDMAYNTIAGEPIVTGQTLNILKNDNAFSIQNSAKNILIQTDNSFIGAKISLIDIYGKEVYTNAIVSNNTEIENRFANGVYILRINHNGQVLNRKVVF